MKYLLLVISLAAITICNAETPKLRHIEAQAVRAPFPPPRVELRPITNQLVKEGILRSPHQPRKMEMYARSTNQISGNLRTTQRLSVPGLVKHTNFTLKPYLHAGRISPPVGIPNRPALDMQTAIRQFQIFFNNTPYRDSHYIFSTYCQYSSEHGNWVYNIHVAPNIYREVESTRPGYHEILTTSYQVDMQRNVEIIETPSWFPRQPE